MGQGMEGVGGLREGGGEGKEKRTALFSRPFIILLLCPLFFALSLTQFTRSLLHLDYDYSVPGDMHLICKTGVAS